MNQYLKLIAPAIGAITVALPFIIANFVSDQASTLRQIAVDPTEEKKAVDGALTVKVDVKTKESGPAEKMEAAAVGWTPAAPAGPEKPGVKKNTAPTERHKAEARKEGAPVDPEKAEAKKDAAPTEPDKAEAKKVAAVAEPDKAKAKKEAVPTKPGARDLALALQTELKRVGCYYGELDGVWGARSRAALYAFGYFSKIKTIDFDLSETWIGRVKGKSKTVCDGTYSYGDPPQQAYRPGDELRYGGRPQQVYRPGDELRYGGRPQQVYRPGDELRYSGPPQQVFRTGDQLH